MLVTSLVNVAGSQEAPELTRKDCGGGMAGYSGKIYSLEWKLLPAWQDAGEEKRLPGSSIRKVAKRPDNQAQVPGCR
jgi:hypothetical protein